MNLNIKSKSFDDCVHTARDILYSGLKVLPKVKEHVSLPWSMVSRVQSGLMKLLMKRLAIYSETIEGSKIAFGNVEVLDKTTPVYQDQPVFHVWVQSDYVAFCPKPDEILKAKCVKLNPPYASLLVHGMFPAKVYLLDSVRGVPSIDETVYFKVTKVKQTYQKYDGFQFGDRDVDDSWMELEGKAVGEPNDANLTDDGPLNSFFSDIYANMSTPLRNGRMKNQRKRFEPTVEESPAPVKSIEKLNVTIDSNSNEHSSNENSKKHSKKRKKSKMNDEVIEENTKRKQKKEVE